MSELKNIITAAKSCECWSQNRKYNYGPLDFLQRNVLYAEGDFKRNLRLYRKLIRFVTDAHTWFIYCYIGYDYHVDCEMLICEVQRVYPEISRQAIWQWIKEEKADYQTLC